MSANLEPELQSGKKILIEFKNRVLRTTVGTRGSVTEPVMRRCWEHVEGYA